ncbi:hypothetical protein PR202_ga02419 [Eleusine coracana subsp. coracana]|uniref:Pectin acetylesterase n=1 Tax=Eleusine coracana subsp. coracana TaxID=191504 RepID=A0AAV5BJT9_ELECO|nr:hypothetical protein PR202_ga02419 [Eleusine coracana subsp. coracana]
MAAASSLSRRAHSMQIGRPNGRCEKDAAGPALCRRQTDAVGKKRNPTELWKARTFSTCWIPWSSSSSSTTPPASPVSSAVLGYGFQSHLRFRRMAPRHLCAWCSAFVWLWGLVLARHGVRATLVDITYVKGAVAKGAGESAASRYLFVKLLLLSKYGISLLTRAFDSCDLCSAKVCLDGSPPAYHLARGFGSGVNSWLVHFEGGGWCSNVTTCLERKGTRLGSSKKMAKQIAFSGILSDAPENNPDFYNWNKVKVRYCDGSSFTGDVEEVDPATKLHYRGARIWKAVMEDLLAKGMNKAENV